MPQPPTAAEAAPEDFGVLIGWAHHECRKGINLSLQSARSQSAWAHGAIDRRHYMMTRNQALILARYLLEATGQTLPPPAPTRGWRAWRRLLPRMS